MTYKRGNLGRDQSDISGAMSEGVVVDPGIDRMFETLADRYRRLILLSVKREAVNTEDDLLLRSDSDHRETEIALVHNHLPKLEDEGFIEWDREAGEISKGPQFDEIAPLLELMENHADELPPDWP